MRGAAGWLLAALCSGAALAQPGSERLAVCGGCHGSNGQSVIAGTPSLAGQPKVFIENQLVIMREGLRNVPAMKPFVADLKDATISALATHYAALPAKAAAAPTKRTKRRPAPRWRSVCCATPATCRTMPASSRCLAWPRKTKPTWRSR